MSGLEHDLERSNGMGVLTAKNVKSDDLLCGYPDFVAARAQSERGYVESVAWLLTHGRIPLDDRIIRRYRCYEVTVTNSTAILHG